MPHLVIDGVFPAWDGRYEFPDFSLSNGELYRIRQISGVRAAELIEALEANDTAAYVAFADVMLTRHGVTFELQYLWNAKVGSLSLDMGEDDADPPPQPLESGNDNEPSPSGTDSETGGG